MGNAALGPHRGVPGQVVEGLYVSDRFFAADRQGLLDRGVTHVLCCCRLLPDAYFPDDFEYLALGIDDLVWQDLHAYIDIANDFVEKALASGGKVLIHCRAGRSRSVALCAAFLVSRRGMTLDDAWALIRSARPCAQPNAGFWAQLRTLRKTNSTTPCHE